MKNLATLHLLQLGAGRERGAACTFAHRGHIATTFGYETDTVCTYPLWSYMTSWMCWVKLDLNFWERCNTYPYIYQSFFLFGSWLPDFVCVIDDDTTADTRCLWSTTNFLQKACSWQHFPHVPHAFYLEYWSAAGCVLTSAHCSDCTGAVCWCESFHASCHENDLHHCALWQCPGVQYQHTKWYTVNTLNYMITTKDAVWTPGTDWAGRSDMTLWLCLCKTRCPFLK